MTLQKEINSINLLVENPPKTYSEPPINHDHHIRPIIDTLKPDLDRVRGDVLVIGGGLLLPERIIVCQSPEYLKLSPNIISLCLVDPSYIGSEPLLLDHDDFLPSDRGKVELVAMRVEDWKVEKTFDAILMFNIQDLSTQLNGNLGEKISGLIKPGGVFVGSGGFVERDPDNTLRETLAGLTIDNLMSIPEGFGYSYGGKHYAFQLFWKE